MALIHGMKKHKFYKRWNGMIQRCYNPKYKDFINGGNQNIVVEHVWDRCNVDGVVNFIDWVETELAKLPINVRTKPFKIIRRDTEKNFSPSNCQLVTSREFSQKRKSTVLTFDKVVELRRFKKQNVSMTLKEMCALFEIDYIFTLSRCLTGKSWANVNDVEQPILNLVSCSINKERLGWEMNNQR